MLAFAVALRCARRSPRSPRAPPHSAGAIPPFLITLLTGSVKITLGLALVLLIGVGGAVYHTATGDDLNHYNHEERWIVLLNFISKTYVATALAANIQYSGSFADRK